MVRIRKRRKGYSYIRNGKKVTVTSHPVTYNLKKKKKKYKRGRPSGLKKVKVYHTKFIQDKKTGLMKGRKHAKGVGERVGIKIDPATGRIFGRFKKIKVRRKK